MRHERQLEVLDRIGAAGEGLVGLFGPSSWVNQAAAYTSPERLAQEVDVLFRRGPTYFGLSAELPEPGSYLSGTVGGVPVTVVRQRDGSLAGVVNACRHRAAPLYDERGTVGKRVVCGYHAWSYELDGKLHSRPLSRGAFDDVSLPCDLHPVVVAEAHGLVFVRAEGDEPIDVDAVLAGAEDDLGAFDLGSYTHIESRANTWSMNWKLVLDTFCESYHIRTLHRDSIAPAFLSESTVFDAFGPNLVSIGLRKNVVEEFQKDRAERSLLPYGTMQYFLVPSGLVVHQLDHIETWRVEPVDVRTTRVVTSVFAPEPPASERALGYWRKNLDLLLQVTGTEDFPLMERIQANLDSGRLPEVVYGRVEYPLVHLHRSIDELLARG